MAGWRIEEEIRRSEDHGELKEQAAEGNATGPFTFHRQRIFLQNPERIDLLDTCFADSGIRRRRSITSPARLSFP